MAAIGVYLLSTALLGQGGCGEFHFPRLRFEQRHDTEGHVLLDVWFTEARGRPVVGWGLVFEGSEGIEFLELLPPPRDTLYPELCDFLWELFTGIAGPGADPLTEPDEVPRAWIAGWSVLLDPESLVHRLDDQGRALLGTAVFRVDRTSTQRVRIVHEWRDGTQTCFGYYCGGRRCLGPESLYYADVTFAPEAPFLRGDSDADGAVTLSDGVATLRHLFLGEAAASCLDAADADDDGDLSITDAIYALNHLFQQGPPPPPPYPEGGFDPTVDALGVCTAAEERGDE